MNQKIIDIPVKDLHLWTENPRDPVDINSSDIDIITKAIRDKNNKWNLPKLSQDMGTFYDFSELPIVVLENGKYIVYDGNRRVSILKYLQDDTLHEALELKLYFDNDVSELISLTTMPCNLCSKEIALQSIERKHVATGSWKALERDIFLNLHRGDNKSLFMWFDEQTGLVSQNQLMNQRFVKEEVLTKENLMKVGFNYNPESGFETNYSDELTKAVLTKIDSLITQKDITTRKNRGQLPKLLFERNPEFKDAIKPYDPKKPTKNLSDSKIEFIVEPKKRKSPQTKPNEILFGKPLYLKKGPVNDLYLGILKIYERNTNDESILPIIGMSLRLILEVGARIYYEEKGDDTANIDQIYKKFLSQARIDMNLSKEKENFVALTNSWLDKSTSIEGLLGKFAHGNIITLKSDILVNSEVIADILMFYFNRD